MNKFVEVFFPVLVFVEKIGTKKNLPVNVVDNFNVFSVIFRCPRRWDPE